MYTRLNQSRGRWLLVPAITGTDLGWARDLIQFNRILTDVISYALRSGAETLPARARALESIGVAFDLQVDWKQSRGPNTQSAFYYHGADWKPEPGSIRWIVLSTGDTLIIRSGYVVPRGELTLEDSVTVGGIELSRFDFANVARTMGKVLARPCITPVPIPRQLPEVLDAIEDIDHGNQGGEGSGGIVRRQQVRLDRVPVSARQHKDP
ncbi:hypothetical protein BDV95DRAFT_588998 [Massariosphaeria phaeospora]|uniref:Uncharacterized protein n=1 Tax=Massariosphaeria phaeospora TaxID=100035 RepID=A0A7C8IIH7_9PLEO|nr:hypothetical protein BDV95DRAFT_588998 [Massariosphaeria phaeospora]